MPKLTSWRVRDALYGDHPDVIHLSPGAVATLTLLLLSADGEGGSITRSIASLAAASHLKPRTIQDRLAELKSAGLLVEEAAPGRGRPPVRRVVFNPEKGAAARIHSGERVRLPAQKGAAARAKGCGVPRERVRVAAPKEYREEDRKEYREDVIVDDAREGGWPASPAMDMSPRGPNAPPTRRQLEYLASLAAELDLPASPEVRTQGEASRSITELKTEAVRRRSHQESTAREEGRRQGLVDGKHEQAANAVDRFVDFIENGGTGDPARRPRLR